MADQPVTAASLVSAAKERVRNLTVEEVASQIEEGDVMLVDLREPAERIQNGTIPGSVHAPRGMLEFWADPSSPYHREEFDPEQKILFYCASGGRSALAADVLQQMGYQDVAHLDGGITAWKEAGKPTEEVEPRHM